jgi:hypothetical protein
MNWSHCKMLRRRRNPILETDGREKQLIWLTADGQFQSPTKLMIMLHQRASRYKKHSSHRDRRLAMTRLEIPVSRQGSGCEWEQVSGGPQESIRIDNQKKDKQMPIILNEVESLVRHPEQSSAFNRPSQLGRQIKMITLLMGFQLLKQIKIQKVATSVFGPWHTRMSNNSE